MAKYVCSVCGFIYDESKGIPEAGIVPETKWEDLPADWICPLCGAEKSEFEKQEESATTPQKEQVSVSVIESSTDMKELSPLEVSALCTNLARGCEKQYKPEEAALFNELAGYFKSLSAPAEDPQFAQLLELIEKDLAEGFPNTNAVASDVQDMRWYHQTTNLLPASAL